MALGRMYKKFILDYYGDIQPGLPPIIPDKYIKNLTEKLIEVKGLEDSTPEASEARKAYYNINYKILELWSRTRFVLEGRAQVLDILEDIINNSKKIVDLGCGSGHIVNFLSFTYPKKTVVGVDFSQKQVLFAMKSRDKINKKLKNGIKSIFLLQDYEEGINVGKKPIDLALLLGTEAYTKDAPKGKNIQDVLYPLLKKGGFLAITSVKKEETEDSRRHFEEKNLVEIDIQKIQNASLKYLQIFKKVS